MVRIPPTRLLLALALPLAVAAIVWYVHAPSHDAGVTLALVGFAGSGVGLFGSFSQLPKLTALREAARSAAKGTLDVPFPGDTEDLVGELGADLESMRKA